MKRPRVAVVGCGAVGRRIVRSVVGAGIDDVILTDEQAALARRVALSAGPGVHEGNLSAALEAEIVVFAHAGEQAGDARLVLESGRHVVSVADELEEVRRLADLGALAAHHGASLVVGAGMSPGLSGLIARVLAGRLETVDEIHVAIHGTGGPACARQHHRSLGGTSLDWHDNEWISRPASSGRELCWFPDPAGPHDCYRAELADPLLLHESFPTASRLSARRSATRRDRLTSRLPMLSPPHRDGRVGGLRVEVRGANGIARRTLIAGIAERPSIAAALLAGTAVTAILDRTLPLGRVLFGDAELPSTLLIDRVRAAGLRVFEFAGAAGYDED